MRGPLFCDCYCGAIMETKDGSNRLAKDRHAAVRTGYSHALKRQFLKEDEQKN